MSKPIPNQPFPDFTISTLNGSSFSPSGSGAENFTLLLFYRGLHCPICKMQLRELDRKIDELNERGVKAIAISMDSQDRARKSSEDWGIDKVQIGYGLGEDMARQIGLYISSARPDSDEPAIFSEPGLFLVRPDGTLYFASIQSMPFTRPPLDQLIQGIDYALEHDYPARGDRTGELETA